MKGLAIFLFFTTFLYSILLTSASLATILPNKPFRDGDTIVSAGEVFTLGFFSPGNSQNRYIGIWYTNISTRTVVWVANREIPLNNTSGVLTLNSEGSLVLRNATDDIIWSSNRLGPAKNPVARLLDTGNLVIAADGDKEPENFIWQSFDYPGDTFLSGMKLGIDFATGIERYLTSWKSVDDPSIGEYTVRITTDGYPQIVQLKGSVIQYRQGPWNGLSWSGLKRPESIYSIGFVFNASGRYYYEVLNTKSVITRSIITADGNFVRMNWIDHTQGWFFYSTPTTDGCSRYRECGAYGGTSDRGRGSAVPLWAEIWKLKVLPKVRMMVWRACYESLPTRVNLARSGVLTDSLCDFCHQPGESQLHCLRDCGFAKQVWFCSPLSYRYLELPHLGVLE